MNNPSCRAVCATLFTLLACALILLVAQGTVICQQPTAQPAQPSSQIQDAKPLVFTVTVTNKKGNYVVGLDKNNFVVLDNKTSEEITYFKAHDEPVSVGIILDVSSSMFGQSKRDLMETLFNESLTRFVQQSNGANEYFLVGFNERPQLLMKWTSKVDDLNAALRQVGSMGPKGHRTALYDACYLGIEKLAGSRHPKRALLLITDGEDNNSHYTFKELRKFLEESDVLLYVIAINSILNKNSSLGMWAGILEELAQVSGGSSFFPEKARDLRNVFELITTELRNQYSIGFNPANYPGDGTWHRVKITLAIPMGSPPDLRHLLLRSREGYFAKANLR